MAYAVDNASLAADMHTNPMRKVTCVFQMKGVGAKNIDVKFLQGVFQMFRDHYVECLHALYFVDAPMVFLGAWQLCLPFVNANTRKKVHFVSGAAGRLKLCEKLGQVILPEDLGGCGEYQYIDEAVKRIRRREGLQKADGSIYTGTRERRSAARRLLGFLVVAVTAVSAVVVGMLKEGFIRPIKVVGRLGHSPIARLNKAEKLLSTVMVLVGLLLGVLVEGFRKVGRIRVNFAIKDG